MAGVIDLDMFNADAALIGKSLQKANKKVDTSNIAFGTSVSSNAPSAPVASSASGVFSPFFTIDASQTHGQSKLLEIPQSIFVSCK